MKLYLLDEYNNEYLLKDVVIPTSVTRINGTIFAGYELNDIVLHSGIEEIAVFAFFNSKLNNVYYNGNDSSWFNIRIDYNQNNPALFANEFYFNYNGIYQSVNSAIISDDIYYIGGHLAGLRQLETLTIGENVNNLENAFVGCDSLDTIYFKKTLNSYLSMGFTGDIPEHILYLLDENNQYYQVTDLSVNTSVYSHFTSIVGLQTVTINEPLENDSIILYENAFSNCPDLENIIINGTIYKIELGALVNNPKLQYNEYENGYYLGNDENPYKIFVSPISKNVTSFTIHNDTIIMLKGSLLGTSINDLTLPFIPHSNGYANLWQYSKYNIIDNSVINLTVTNSKVFPQISKSSNLRTVTFELGLNVFEYPYEYLYITKLIVKGESTFEGLQKDYLMHLPMLEYTIYNNGKYLGTIDNPYQVLCGAVDESQPVIANENCKTIL